ncbi:MAG: tetratricopeptide repeat protein [Myxococcaceae bacterium]|nr:tetratricopeptide repeat protein [Myxococcaceae bacterium]
MSDRNEVPRTFSVSSIPAVDTPAPGAAAQLAGSIQNAPPAHQVNPEDAARARIASLEREARALGSDPAAALLFHEVGLLWEDPLKNPRNAAVAYQNAFKLAPTFVANIQAARRLFADVGNWQMVVQLLDAELAATEDPARRAPLLYEKAVVLEDRLSREDEAQRALRQCLDAKPKDVTLLVQLEARYAEKNDHAALVEVYRLFADALEDGPLRAHYLTQAGALLEHRLGRPEDAAQALREAFALDRRDPLLLAAEIRISERDARIEDLIAALAAEAELLGPQAAPTYLRLAKVYEKLGRQEDALAALLAARRVSPNEPLVLSELAQIYETQSRHEDLADVLLSWAESVSDESELVALNLRLAALYEEDLKRDDAAIARYRAILDAVPGHQAALAGLGKLYFRLHAFDELVKVFDAEIAALEDPRQQAARMYKAAEILEERLGRQEEAIQRYNRCLQLQPGYLPAQKALTRLYEQQDRWAELAAMYEQDLLQTADRDEMIATLNKMASLYEDRLNDIDRAIDCMRRILEIAADHLPTLRNLARLYERAGRWQELIELNETEASFVGDTKQVLSLHHRNAELLEEQLKDLPGAVAAWERLLALSPSYLPALKALGRLYAQEGRWEDLIRMYRAEAELSPTPEAAAALVHKIGELYEHKLKNENDAIAAYQEVLTLSPSYFPALRALARIYRAQGAWESLIDVLRAEAANRTDPAERANALYQAAAIWENQLGRQDMAIDGYQEVLRLTPGHAAAIRALERLYTARDDRKELIAVLDRETQTGQTPQARVAAYLKLAHLYLDRMNEPARAAKVAEAALALDPGNLTALKLLERIRAGDRARRSELRARIAERVSDPRLKTALELCAAVDREAPGAEIPVDAVLEGFEANPGDVRLSFQLERAFRKSADAPRLLRVYERRLETLTDPMERTALLVRIAELARHKLGDAAKAKAAYERALELTPGFLPALQGLRAIALAAGAWDEARALLETEGKSARDNDGAIDAWVQAGQIAWTRQQDADAALACFKKALERNPLEPRASAGVEEILAARGGAADLAQLQERRGEAMLAKKSLPGAAAEFFSAALTWANQLNDEERALTLVDRALAAQPTHVEALELKARLCLARGEHAEAAAALALRIQQGGDAQHLSALHLQLGALYQDHLGDATRAAAHLQTALAANPKSSDALRRLADIHTASRNWTGASDCLKRLIDLETVPAELARHTLSLAQILDEGIGDAQGASALYRRALELAPGDETVIARLVQLYERTGNLPELAALLEQQAQAATDVKRAIMLRLKVADLYAGPLDEPQKAIAYYRYVVDLDGSNVPAHAALATLFMRDAAAAPMAVEEHRTLLRLDPARLDSLHALFRLWESVKQIDKAFCAAGILGFFRAQNDAEAAFYNELRNRLPQDASQRLSPADVETVLHPRVRQSALVEVLRAIGDQLSRIHPPNFESAGIDRRADRLKPDHAVSKAIRSVAQIFGVEDFDVYQSRRGLMFLETSEPLAVCVGQDVVRKYNAREQKFLIGRAVLGLLNKAAVLQKLSRGEVADLIGNSVRIFHPEYTLGRRNDDLAKQLRKAYSRKALKQLEPAADALFTGKEIDLVSQLEGLTLSADRAGLLVCGDVAIGLNMLLRDDPNYSAMRPDATDPVLQAVTQRQDLRELLAFALSDEFFRLRARAGMSIA